MRAPTSKIATSAVLAGLLLSGCFMEVEGDSVTIDRDIGTFIGIPTEFQTPQVIALASQANAFTIDIGEQDFVVARKEFGPVTMDGTLSVNQAIVRMLDATSTRNFAALRTLELWQLPDPACAGAQCQEVMLARYAQPAGGLPAPSQVVMAGTGANALVLVQNGRFTLQLRATGQIPAADWHGAVTLDGHLKARAGFP